MRPLITTPVSIFSVLLIVSLSQIGWAGPPVYDLSAASTAADCKATCDFSEISKSCYCPVAIERKLICGVQGMLEGLEQIQIISEMPYKECASLCSATPECSWFSSDYSTAPRQCVLFRGDGDPERVTGDLMVFSVDVSCLKFTDDVCLQKPEAPHGREDLKAANACKNACATKEACFAWAFDPATEKCMQSFDDREWAIDSSWYYGDQTCELRARGCLGNGFLSNAATVYETASSLLDCAMKARRRGQGFTYEEASGDCEEFDIPIFWLTDPTREVVSGGDCSYGETPAFAAETTTSTAAAVNVTTIWDIDQSEHVVLVSAADEVPHARIFVFLVSSVIFLLTHF